MESLAQDIRYQQYFMNVIVRTSGDPAALARPLRAVLRDIDPTLPVTSLETMPETMASRRSVSMPRCSAPSPRSRSSWPPPASMRS